MSETMLAAGLMALTKIDWTCTIDLNIKGRAIKSKYRVKHIRTMPGKNVASGLATRL